MAQAEQNVTTRRGFSKWLAAMGAVAVAPAATQAAEVSAHLRSAGEGLDSLSAQLIASNEKVDECRKVVARWTARHPIPNSDDYEGEPYWVAYNRDKSKWFVRETSVKRQSGLGRAQKTAIEASEAFSLAVQEFSLIKCASMSDVLYKARLACTHDNSDAALSQSVVYDLIALTDV